MTSLLACSACGDPDRPIFNLGNQWCRPCTRRWYRAGMPESGPPPFRGNNAGLAAWRSLPVPEVSREASELERGIAAEHLVCADLLLQGYRAFMTDQTCPYDVAVDIGNLIRVQVKSTRGPRIRCTTAAEPVYAFSTARPYGRRVYDDDAFELLALVALDIRLIAYLPPAFKTRSGVCIRQPGQSGRLGPQKGKQFADFPFAKAVAELGVT